MARDTRLLARLAPWLSGAVLVAGVAAFLAVHFVGGGSNTPPHVRSTLLPAERRVALEFVHTAVARKNLARAWEIAAPELKRDTTRDEWLAGTMRVVPYPVDDKPVLLRTASSFEDVADLDVSIGTQPFTLGLRNIGGKWLVSAWSPAGEIQAPSGK